LTLTDRRIGDVQFEAKQAGREMGAQEALLQILYDQKGKRHGRICVGVAEQMKAMGDEERGSVLSAARTQTQWLDDERIKAVLCRTDFEMADLKRRQMTVYLCLPAMRMATHARWLRLMILLALSVMERTRVKPPAPVLFVLDEFPILGHVEVIEKAAGLMAGFDVKLWVIVQNLGQLKQHYNKAWQTFFANSGVVTAFGVADQETLREVSAKLGRMRTAEQVRTGAVGHAMLSGSAAFREDHFDVPLLAEHELSWIFGREQKRMLIFATGLQPAIAERLEYFDEPMFDGMYEKDR
jgi:type IV secretion system protein VirD4